MYLEKSEKDENSTQLLSTKDIVIIFLIIGLFVFYLYRRIKNARKGGKLNSSLQNKRFAKVDPDPWTSDAFGL